MIFDDRSIVRATATVALMMVLGACGGSAAPSGLAARGPKVPAATLVGDEAAKELLRDLRDVEPIPSPTLSAEPSPSPVAVPSRTIGPAGTPTATTLAQPASAGRWEHRITVSGSTFPTTTFEFDVIAHAATTVGGARRQEFEWDIDQFPQRFIYDWTDDELLLIELHTTNPDGSKTDCKLEPPSLELRLPLAVGATWESNAKCDGEGQRQEHEVIRTERLTIGGTPVDTFVVEQVSSSRTDQCGKVTTVERSWFAPSLRMFARLDTDVSTTRTGPGCGSFRTNIDLLEVSPGPAEE